MYTRKQTKIILLIAAGMTNKEIAVILGIEEGSVSNHRKRILKQSGCRNWNHLMGDLGRTGQLDKWENLTNPPHNANETDNPTTV